MTVTVIPLEQNREPFSLIVQVSASEDKNLKQVFSQERYWSKVFLNHSPTLPPVYR